MILRGNENRRKSKDEKEDRSRHIKLKIPDFLFENGYKHTESCPK